MLVESSSMLLGRPAIPVHALAVAMAIMWFNLHGRKILNNAHSGCDAEWMRGMSMFPIPFTELYYLWSNRRVSPFQRVYVTVESE